MTDEPMFKNATSATTVVPVLVTPCAATIEGSGRTAISLLEFTIEDRAIASRLVRFAEEDALAEALFLEPVVLHLDAFEDADGAITGTLYALIPQVDDPDGRYAPSPYPLGATFVPAWRRQHPRDLGEEVRSLLSEMASAPAAEACQAAVDAFLRTC